MLVVRHPQWRVPGLEVVRDFNPPLWEKFTSIIWDFVDLLRPEWRSVVNPEICGSFAFMFSKPRSDIDINFACDNWRDLHQLDYVRRASSIFQSTCLLEKELGVTLQIASRTVSVTSPEAPRKLTGQYPVYSLRDKCFYNKVDYEVFPHTLRWDRPTSWWEVLPPKNISGALIEDPFAEEVPKYAEMYGKYYLPIEVHEQQSDVEI